MLRVRRRRRVSQLAVKEEPDWVEPYRSPSLSPEADRREKVRVGLQSV